MDARDTVGNVTPADVCPGGGTLRVPTTVGTAPMDATRPECVTLAGVCPAGGAASVRTTV
jgi:hypothetical protein